MNDETAIAYLHPLFDRTSLYRLTADESLFACDNGEQSVVDFFEGRRRRSLREEWIYGPPERAQDWGLGPIVNGRIHEKLIGSEARKTVPQAAPPIDRSPALLVYRLDRPGPIVSPTPIRAPGAGLFPGCGRSGWPATIDAFDIKIGPPAVRDLPDGHLVVLFLATPSLIRSLATAVGVEAGPDPVDADAIRVLDAALAEESLTSLRPRGRAAGVSILLASSPAIQGLTRGGTLECPIALDRECPSLDDGTFAVLCIGPMIAPPRPTGA